MGKLMSEKTNKKKGGTEEILIREPSALAYEIASSSLEEFLIQPRPVDPDPEKIKNLIGLQIEFKKKIVTTRDTGTIISWQGLLNPKIVQLFFTKKPDDGASYFERVETGIELKKLDTRAVVVHPYEVINPGDEWSTLGSFNPPLFNNTIVYSKLDFYKNVRLVYFSLEHLKFLTFFYEKLVISGCQLNLGRKLHHTDLSAIFEKKIFLDDYFSLKIEGSELSPKKLREDATTIVFTESETDATGTDVAIGHPCPPRWETFLAVFSNAMGRYPSADDTKELYAKLPGIWNAWNKIS